MIIAVLALAAIAWALLLVGGRMPAVSRIPLAVTLMLGVTGYVLIGQPGLAGAPVPTPERPGFGERLTDPRQGMAQRFGPAAQWLGLSDGLIRSGRTEAGVRALQAGLRRQPRNIDLWVGLGNALVAHAGGVMTPAAALAYDRAADIDPSHPAPPFFAGLSLAQGGDVEGARAVWQQLLDNSAGDAPWRADLVQRLAQLPPARAPAPAAPAAPAAVAPAGPAVTPLAAPARPARAN